MTAKHQRITMDNNLSPKNPHMENGYKCSCGKQYMHKSGLSKHKKTCTYKNKEDNIIKESGEGKEYKEMFLSIIEQNKELINLCKEQSSVLKEQSLTTPQTINNTNISNSNNKIFNIQVFLNEDCKDAMNMTEFIESIKLSIEDVEKIGIEGQTQALSSILSTKLIEMDVFKRPVHCSDYKKEIIYVKDEDKWEQEEKDRPKLKKALDKIAKESLCKVPEIEQNEEQCVKTISEILKDPREDKKIISRVSRDILIEK
jgi:hypothetical protein